MERFWSKVQKSNGCWLWTAHRDDRGYGRFGFNGKHHKAHRLAYAFTYGEIPPGAHILHDCDNPPCVNPEHLHIGTHTDNMREQRQRGRNYYLNKTICKHGHPYDAANTYPRPNGGRDCRTCRAAAKKRYRERIAQSRKAA